MKKVATIYKSKSETLDIKFNRVWAMPNHETFKIGPIKELLGRYVKDDGDGWIDPFSGANSPARITNDHNPNIPAMFHMEAIDFVYGSLGNLNGIIFDPPYSFQQISEHYKFQGMKATGKTTMAFYEKVKSAVCEKIKKGGYAISFGWNSNGFGKARGFKIVEILMVAHGGSKNDTICVVEIKI